MTLIARLGLACAIALAACSPQATTSTATTSTTTTSTAPQRIHLGPAVIPGAWSFDGTCGSGDGMVLQPNGTASINEDQAGLWGIDGDGRLIVLTQQVEPGDTHAPGGPAATYVFEMREPDQDHLYSVDQRANAITAKRCPSDAAAPPPD